MIEKSVAKDGQFKELELFQPEINPTELALIEDGIQAGFPSPATDHLERLLDINEYLIKNRPATFYARVKGKSMLGAGFNVGDIMVIDRSLEPGDGKIAICYLDGEFTVKRLKVEKKRNLVWLMPENEEFEPILITPENEGFLVWGIVTFIIKKV